MLEWTDARRPVPRLWIRSAEERGERRYENRNTTTTINMLEKFSFVDSLVFEFAALSFSGSDETAFS